MENIKTGKHKQKVISHCSIKQFIESCKEKGWLVVVCMEVASAAAFIASYREIKIGNTPWRPEPGQQELPL